MAGMSKLASKLSSRNSAVFAFGVAAVWLTARQFSSIQKHRKEIPIVIGDHPLIKKDRAAVDAVFFNQLKRILKIILPGWFSAEGWYMFLVAVALAARTYCDVWMIQNGTAIESSIIGRNVDLFKSHLYKFIYTMPVISIVNNTLKYGLNELKLRFRTRLSYYLFQKYLKGFTYYKMSNLDNRIANADHLLTQDVEKLCTSIGDLYSNLSKVVVVVVVGGGGGGDDDGDDDDDDGDDDDERINA
ncbi:hypothetical protein NP493_4976g00001 [Ridgeia piscesae]|uniref:ABC transmembrane type-1 domain-containing protein n=1 Tax=Ridgeia piscesae TaxID=27915 RepID=A0AAD9MT94_RIDPI|nr:hypothetical protein NP493_4976g00001 [Ridgeia piscesae]